MAQRLTRSLATWGHDAANQSQLLLAAKAAVAAALAWYLAPLVPFAADEYSYYAPLGVLVSMYPTLARSMTSGLQAIVGLAIGIGLGVLSLGLVNWGAPGILAVGIVVGLGVMLGGIKALGAGRDWIAIAGLFVLLLGGQSVEEFSISYLVTMAFGVLVGLLVNLLVFPPLYLRRASARLSVLRNTVAARLRELGVRLESGPADQRELEDAMEELARTVATVRAEVNDADESRKANPRAWRRRAERDENFHRLQSLEGIAFQVRDLADIIEHMEGEPGTRLNARDELAIAIGRAADLVEEPPDSEQAGARLEAAEQARARYLRALDNEAAGTPSRAADDLTASVCLRRIIASCRSFIE